MAHIKQYRIMGVGYSGNPYELVANFIPSQGGRVNSAEFIEDVGFPERIAQSMVDRWNSVVDVYRRSDPDYRGPTYSLVESEPEHELELFNYGQWTPT